MSKLATSIWYGRAHNEEDVHTPHFLPILGWTAFLLLLTALRLSLPFVETPILEIHTQVLDSLMSGQIWGRQALVSSMEYPPLTTLALFFAKTIADLLQFPPGHVLVAIAQIWGLFYLLRIPRGWLARAYTGFAMALILTVNQEARSIFYLVDPNWVVVIPAACAIYHFVFWCRWQSLRDVVLLGINCGLLIFAGTTGCSLVLILLLLVSYRIRSLGKLRTAPAETCGTRLLLWVPAVYTFGLMFIGNWLIMHNGLFFVRRFYQAFAAGTEVAILHSIGAELTNISWLILGSIALCFLKLNQPKRRTIAIGLGGSLITLVIMVSLLKSMKLYTPGGQILIFLLALGGILMPLWEIKQDSKLTPRLLVEIIIIGVLVAAGALVPRPGVKSLALKMETAPHRAEVLAAADKYTPETRIMTYSFRTPAHYPDLDEKRFLPRVDFNEKTLRWRAQTENFLYVLLPPSDGTFYGKSSTLADLHENGRPWLVLEQSWPSGWQLWRVLNPK